MIRVFVRTDETMPEHELLLKNADVTIGVLMNDFDRVQGTDFVQIKSAPGAGDEYIRFGAVRFLRVTEE